MTVAVGQGRPTIPDGVLVQEAAAGSGASYGTLYDRYATQVYNYSLRLTGSPEDAADATHEAFLNVLRRLQDDDRPVLDFGSYLFAAARNESYALMRRRSRVYPTETVPEQVDKPPDAGTDPERVALLHDSQEAVRAANARLAPRHREVLALRELGDRSYDEIGQIMGISENGAAQLIWRARSKMREALTAGAVASVVATSADCERAQLLLTRIQDEEFVDEWDREWLDEHIEECGSCRAARGMLLEVGATYGCWLPVAALATLRPETLAAAGHVVGADWTGVGTGAPAGGSGGAAAVAGVATLAALGIALAAIIHDDSQLERPITQPAERPAVSAPAVAPKKEREPPPASRAEAAVTAPGVNLASRDAVRALRRPASPRGDAPAGTPRSNPPERPRGDGPRDSNPPPPGAETPGPAPPGPPQPHREPPVDPGPPPAPPQPEPPVDTKPPPDPPPPPSQSGCTWPGGGGGPAGCPPGHGGVPPGHGGIPPGQGSTAPGRA